VEREGRAIALLPGFQIFEQPTDVGEEQVADLGLVMKRRLDLGERVFQVPVLVGKEKRGPDLLKLAAFFPSPRNRYPSKAVGKERLRGSKLAAAAHARKILQIRS